MDDDWFDDSESLYPEGMDGPTVRTPSVDVPTAPEDVFQRSEIARLFVLHVFVWNAVVLLLSLGVMLIYFRNDWNTGQRLLVAGVILAGYGIYRWPRGSDGSASAGDEEGAEGTSEPVDTDGEDGEEERERRDEGDTASTHGGASRPGPDDGTRDEPAGTDVNAAPADTHGGDGNDAATER